MEKLSNSEKSESGQGESDSENKENSSSSENRSSNKSSKSTKKDPKTIDPSSENNKSNRTKATKYNAAHDYCHPIREESKFIELSVVNEPEARSEPGYFADHPPSDSVKLSDKDSKPATDEMPKIEKLSIVKKAQPNSLELYRPKLADYKENVNRIEEIKENEENEEVKQNKEVKEFQNNEEVKVSQSKEEVKVSQINEEQKFVENNKNDKEIIIDDDEFNYLEEEKIPNEHLNKRNDIINRQIIRRGMINNDSDNNIFISINKFSDQGSREVTGYYGQNNYIDSSNSVSMISSELNNEEDKNMDVSHKLPLPYTEVYKSIPKSSKPDSNIKGTDKILRKSELSDEMLYKSKAIRDLDPIRFYTLTTGMTGGLGIDGKEYELDQFRFRLFLYDERHREVISNSRRLKKLPNINRLSIEDIQYNRDINVKDFLLNVAPHTLEQFIFGGDWKYRLKVTFYLEGLHAVLKSTTREVRFGFCKFSSSDLQSIFIAAKHINTLWFNWCELYFTDEFDIKEESFHIEELSLEV